MLASLVLLPYAAAIACALLPNSARNATAWLAGLTALAGCALLGIAAPAVFGGQILRVSLPWFADVAFGFRMDGLAWAFALVILGIGALVVLYARYYLSAEDPPARFYAFLLAFMGAMLGIVLADNLILMVVFWELTSVSSFLLIGFWNQRARCEGWSAHGAHRDRHGGVVPVGRRHPARPDRRQLFPRRRAGRRRAGSRRPAVSAHAGADTAGRLHQIGAVPVSLLAAARDGGAHASFRVPAFRDDGEGRRVPVGALLPDHGRQRSLVLCGRRHRPADDDVRRGRGHLPAGSEGTPCVFDDQPSGPHHAAVRTELAARGGGGPVPYPQSRRVQGIAVHGGGHHRPRDGVARHAAVERPLAVHADHRNAGDGRVGGDGRRAAAERLPVQGDVLRRDGRPRCVAPDRVGCSRDSDGRGRAGRGVQHALHPRRVLQRPAGRAHADAARAAALAARARGGPGRRVPRRGHRPQLDHRTRAGGDGERHAGHAAGIQPGALARFQCASADERASRSPRAWPCTSDCSGTSTCIR